MTHPLLKDPENARAYAHLLAESNGSVRTWAKSLGWSQGKLQRFLKAVSKEGLGTIEVQYRGRGSIFKPPVSGCIVSHRIGNQVPDSGLTTKSDFGGLPPVELQEQTAELVALMNEILCKKHPMDYLPVSARSSLAAAHVWLIDLGIPFPAAIEILTARCSTFDTHKINGDMPKSLAFFTKSVKARWEKIQGRRHQLGLFPKMDMHVAPRVSAYRPEPPGKTKPETIARTADEWRAIANSKSKPQRMA